MTAFVLRRLERTSRAVPNPFNMGPECVRPARGDAQRDFQKIAGDMGRLGKNLKHLQRSLVLTSHKPGTKLTKG